MGSHRAEPTTRARRDRGARTPAAAAPAIDATQQMAPVLVAEREIPFLPVPERVAPSSDRVAPSSERVLPAPERPTPGPERTAASTSASRPGRGRTARTARTDAPVDVAPPRRRSTRVLGRAGVLAALVGVTVVVPVTQGLADGDLVVGTPVADADLPSTVAALTALPLSDLPPRPLVSADGAARARELAGVSRDAERSALPGCDGSVRAAGSNGLLATKDLCTLWDGRTQMRADAAVALAELNEAHVARFGTDLCLSSGYRTLAQQKAVKAQKGGLAATPGKSNHGWGLAMDFCSIQTSGPRWTWLNDNGPVFGWEQPSWAVRGGSGPYEPWHWEYTKGVMADGEYYG